MISSHFIYWNWLVPVLDFKTLLGGCTELVDLFHQNFSNTWDCFFTRIHFILFGMRFHWTMMLACCKCTFALVTGVDLEISFGYLLVIIIIVLTFYFQSRNIKICKITPLAKPCRRYQKSFASFFEIDLVDAT